jgi:hypothetical protein
MPVNRNGKLGSYSIHYSGGFFTGNISPHDIYGWNLVRYQHLGALDGPVTIIGNWVAGIPPLCPNLLENFSLTRNKIYHNYVYYIQKHTNETNAANAGLAAARSLKISL